MTSYSLSHLRGRALEASYDRVASAGARTLAVQLAHLAELDHQRYYIEAGCRSMFRYCVDRKGLSEDVAVQWIRTARVALAYPRVFEAIAERRITVSAVCLLSKHLTPANAAELLSAAEKRSIKQVILLIAERFGRPSRLGPLPAQPGGSPDSPATLWVTGENSPVTLRVTGDDSPATSRADGDDSPVTLRVAEPDAPNPGGVPTGAPRRARLEPIAPGLFELVVELDQQTHDQLEASRDLLGHAVPSGNLAEVLERAIARQYARLRRRRCGAADRPRTGANGSEATPRHSASPRHVPDAVRRAVWERDGGQCAFTSVDGQRCEERACIELDHVVPVARGGRSTVENLRLLCRAHNQFEAEREFGMERMQERLKYALGCMAPQARREGPAPHAAA